MDISKITVGKRVAYKARTRSGKGTVSLIDTSGGRGVFVHITDKNHPKGKVAVRPGQVSSAK